MLKPIACVLALLVLAGCRPESARAPATSDGGTLLIAVPGEPDKLLPVLASTQIAAHVTARIFPRLAELKLDLDISEDSGYTPVLARSWEHRDSTTLVFHLDPRARWHDGTPITAADVVFTFDVYRDTLTASPYRTNLDPVASVTAIDSLTVAFAFRHWYPEQLYDATYHLLMMPKHLLDTIPRERLASSSFARNPVGAGPFRFGHWEPGTEISVEADTGWFLGRPHLDRIVWRMMPDAGAAVTALLAGEDDAMEFIPQKDDIDRVASSPEFQLVPYPSPFLFGLLFNLRRPLFASVAVRRAIAMAIDRETIVRSIFGAYGDVPVGGATRTMWIAREPVRQIPFDTAAAGRLLDSLGWARGPDGIRRHAGRRLEFSMMVPTTSRIRQAAAVLVESQLKQAGIAVRIQPVELGVFDQKGRSGEFDAEIFSRTLDPSPANLVQFWGSASVGTGDNLGAYRSPTFDSLLATASRARSRDLAKPIWRQVLERLNDDAPAVFLMSPRNNAAIHRRFEHVTIRPDSWLATVAGWSVAPDRRLPRDR